MKIQEAIKTGLHHRVFGERLWVVPDSSHNYTLEQILSDNWIVKQPEKKMKKVKFWLFYFTGGGTTEHFYSEDLTTMYHNNKVVKANVVDMIKQIWIKTNCFIEVEVEDKG